MLKRLIGLAALVLMPVPAGIVRAEFPALEAAFKEPVASLADSLEGKTVLVSMDETFKMQLPVDVPDSYTLRARIKRIFADNAYVFVLVVGGRQVVLTMDGFKGNQTTGLGLVAGKKENANVTTYNGKIFPMDKVVAIEIDVTKTSVVLKADGKTIVDWKGDAADLSLPKTWAVSNSDWLALGCYMAEFETTLLALESK